MSARSTQSIEVVPSQATRRREFLSPIFDGVVTLGGVKKPAGKIHAKRPNTSVFAFDNAKETAANQALHDRLGITSVSVGEGHTTFTLFRQATKELQQACRHNANTATHTGMGANAVFGNQAGKLYSMAPAADSLSNMLVDQALNQTGGAPELERLRVLSSIMGGTGAGLSPLIAQLMADALIKPGVPVALEFDLLGSLTLTGVSPTGRFTTGAVLPALIDLATNNSNPAHDLITRRLELHELPPVGEDHALRTQLLLLEEQAITSQQFRDQREIVIPNSATHNRYGNIFLRETDFLDWLDPVKQVRPAVAAKLYAALYGELRAAVQPDPSFQVLEVWDDVGADRPRPSVENVVAICLPEFSDFLASIEQPGRLPQFQLAFTLPDGSRFDAHRVDELYCSTPQTLTEAGYRLHLLLIVANVTQQIEADCEQALSDIAKEQSIDRRKLRKTHLVATRSWFNASRLRATARLIPEGRITRELADEQREWESKRQEAQQVTVKLVREAKKLQAQLEAIERTLAKFLPQGPEVVTTEYVRVTAADEAFPTLLQLPTLAAEEQTDELCTLVAAVTLPGVAAMLGAQFVDVDEIARIIVFGAAAYRSPPFGGVRRQSAAKLFYALPPMDAPFLGELQSAISRLNHSATVVANDSAGCGAGVLRIRYREVRSLKEVFVGVVKTATIEAHSCPDRRMVCLGDEQTLARLGMTIIDGELHFSEPPPVGQAETEKRPASDEQQAS